MEKPAEAAASFHMERNRLSVFLLYSLYSASFSLVVSASGFLRAYFETGTARLRDCGGLDRKSVGGLMAHDRGSSAEMAVANRSFASVILVEKGSAEADRRSIPSMVPVKCLRFGYNSAAFSK